MIVERLAKEDEVLWESYVENHPEATFGHTLRWRRLVRHCYGNRFKPAYHVAKQGKSLIGILPLFEYAHPFSDKRLISVPFSVSGGPCADNSTAEAALIDEAIRLTKMTGSAYLELRNIKPKLGNLIIDDRYHTLVLSLNPDPQMLYKDFRKGIKQGIKTAEKNNVRVDLNVDDIDMFYRVYARGQRDLGTPVLSYDWVKHLYEDSGTNHAIAAAYHEDRVIGVQFVRAFKESVVSVFAYNLPEYKQLCPNHLLLWELIQQACSRGYRTFNLGRSLEDTGTFYFKTGWRAEPVKFHYQYYMNKSSRMPDYSQSSKSRNRFAGVWKRLPLPVANTMGPLIRGYFP